MPSTPGIVNYPTLLDDAVSLIQVANNATTTLSGPIAGPDLIIPVGSTAAFTDSGVVTIVDSANPTQREIVLYTSKTATTLIVPSGGRGAQASTAQAFATGATVSQRPTARHHTVLADAIIALQNKFGIGTDTPGGGAEALLSDSAGQALWRAIQQADIAGLATALANAVKKNDAALQTIISDLLISKNTPALTLTHTGVSKNWTFVVTSAGQLVIGEVGISNAISIDSATGVVTLEEIPLLPSANPTTTNQAVRKGYLDEKKAAFSLSWFIVDPMTSPGGLGNQGYYPVFVVPDGVSITMTKIKVVYGTGSHTSGTIFGARLLRSTQAGNWDNWTLMGAVELNDTNSSPLDVYTVDIADVVLTANDIVAIYFDRGGPPLTERNITIIGTGTQQLI